MTTSDQWSLTIHFQESISKNFKSITETQRIQNIFERDNALKYIDIKNYTRLNIPH